MILLGVSQFGNDVRVRLHEHPYEPGDTCGPECYEYASERTYSAREDSPRYRRHQIALAAVAALNTPTLGHVEFLSLLSEQPTLFRRP